MFDWKLLRALECSWGKLYSWLAVFVFGSVLFKNLDTYEEELSDLIAVCPANVEEVCQAFQEADDTPWL